MIKKTILPLLLTAFFTSFFNRVFAGSWYSWFMKIYLWIINLLIETPLYVYIVLFLLLVFLFLIISHIKRKKAYTKGPGIIVISTPRYGYKDLGYRDYLKVKWLFQFPRQDPYDPFMFDNIRSTDPYEMSQELNVEGPFCPKCQTELRESARFLGGYKWICDKCHFQISQKVNKYSTKEKVKKVFQSEFRRQIIEHRKKKE